MCALRAFVNSTKKVPWSARLLGNLLDELFVDEDFRQLIGTPADVPKRNYAQAVLIALAIRHSWREDDLARFLRRAGVRTTNGHAHR